MAGQPKYAAQNIPIDDVFIVGDRRVVNDDKVNGLAQSIEQIGLHTPITVRVDMAIPDPDTGEVLGGYALVAGRHRLEAFRKMGRADIPAIILECDELDAELWEIDENLMRAELTEGEESQHLARRKVLWGERERRKNQVEKVFPPEIGYKRPPDQAKGFARETAEITGKSKQSINQKIARAEKIAPDVMNEVTGSKWDKGVVFDILKKLDHDEQRQALNRVRCGASSSFTDAYEFIKGDAAAPRARNVKSPPEPMSDNEAMDQWLSTGLAWWNRGSQDWREEFLRRIDTPAFDRSRSGRAA